MSPIQMLHNEFNSNSVCCCADILPKRQTASPTLHAHCTCLLSQIRWIFPSHRHKQHKMTLGMFCLLSLLESKVSLHAHKHLCSSPSSSQNILGGAQNIARSQNILGGAPPVEPHHHQLGLSLSFLSATTFSATSHPHLQSQVNCVPQR